MGSQTALWIFLGRFYGTELVCCCEWERGRRGPGAWRWVTAVRVRVCAGGCVRACINRHIYIYIDIYIYINYSV